MDYSKEEKQKIVESLAKDIINLSRSSILINMKFMGNAINRVNFKTFDKRLACDGETMFYNPDYVVASYKKDKNQFTREYMHTVMHCVFRHMFVDHNAINMKAWDTACDIAVEKMINDFEAGTFNTENSQNQSSILSNFKDIKPLTAEKLYHHFIENEYTDDELDELQTEFSADSHDIWYKPEDNGSSVNGFSINMNKEELDKMWKEVSEQMQLDLETFSREHGSAGGSFMQNLKSLNREKYDYSGFLKKFAVMGEKMIINPDEFEYNFYTYGLELYGNMPLIEPLEYKDVKLVKEFVIAIDTSGSVSGGLVQSFIQKTYNILKQQENFFNRINIHIIQCDAEIQEDKKITNQEEFDEYLSNMTLRGFGGTDFRPVFSYVDKLIEEKEFTNLKGMIYFTDGYGVFPQKKPSYESAFVFVNEKEDEYNPPVPAWAIKLVLTEEEINNCK